MRSKPFISVLGAAAFVFGTALIVNNFSFAQELIGNETKAKEVKTEIGSQSTSDQMAELIESQNKLTNALEKLLVQQEPEVQSGVQMSALTTGTAPRPNCTSDANTWNSSNTYQQSDWDMLFVANSNSTDHFDDVNGDGLLDYFFANRSSTGGSVCVYLNTGSGWERVYKCTASYNSSNSTWTYKGDCAA